MQTADSLPRRRRRVTSFFVVIGRRRIRETVQRRRFVNVNVSWVTLQAAWTLRDGIDGIAWRAALRSRIGP